MEGDAGFIWDKDYPYTVETLQQVFPGTVTFIEGNHENHALLNSMEVCMWNSGRAHRAGERVYHLMRGEVYTIYGERYFTFGGARSVDKGRRTENVSWWKEEEPAPEELEYGRARISREKQIDTDYALPAVLDEWYRLFPREGRLKKWYFGHMHVDQLIEPKLRGIHHDILLVGEEEPIRWR